MRGNPSRQAGILLLGKVLATTFEFAVPLVMVRLLGKAEVGVLGALLVLYNTLALVVTAGLPDTLLYHLPKRPPGERGAIARRVVAILAAFGAVAGAILALVAAAAWLAPNAVARFIEGGDALAVTPEATAQLLLLLALYPLVDVPGRLLPNLLVVEGRARAAAATGVFKAVGGSLAFILPLALGADLRIVVASLVGFGAAYAGVLAAYLGVIYRGAPRVPSPVSAREIVGFGVPLGATDIVSMLNGSVDAYLVMLLFPAATFAEFRIGAWQIPVITTIAYTVGTAFAPRLAELIAEGDPRGAIRLWRETVGKVAMLVMPLAAIFIVAAEETIELLFTADYLRGASVFRIYAILTLGRVAAFGVVIVAAGRPRYVLHASLFSLVSNVVISVPLALLVGFNGPALGTLVAFVPTVAFYCWAIARALGLHIGEVFPVRAYGGLLALTAAACVPAAAFKLWSDLGPGLDLAAVAGIVLLTFAALGSVTGAIRRADWQYLGDWMSLRILR